MAFPATPNPLKKKKPIQEQTLAKSVDFSKQNTGTGLTKEGKVPTNVNFNPDKSVAYTTGGKTFNLSKEEYAGFLTAQGSSSAKGGIMTPQVQNLLNISKREALRAQINRKLQLGGDIQSITNELLAAEATRQGLNKAEEEAAPLTPEQLAPTTTEPKDMTTLGKINVALGAPPEKASQSLKETGGRVVEPILKTGAKVYDFVYSLTQGGKSISQIEAEKTFNKLEGDLNEDLTLVEAGIQNPDSVQTKIRLARDAIDRLEGSIKGLGKLNFRYWLLDGKDVEAQILINKQNLDDFQRRLDIARQKYEQTQIMASYGQNGS